jgi:membrane-bound inhibitor of C-type lysozyme
MSFKKIILLIIILISGFFVYDFFFKKEKVEYKEVENIEQVKGTEVTYTNSENGQTLKVLYDNEKDVVSIYSGEPDEIIMSATTSASGAKYENLERGIVLWNKEKEVSLYLNDSLIFSGVEQ